MYIWLCYKRYKLKITASAKRDFEDLTGKDLLGSIQEVMICFLGSETINDFRSQTAAKNAMTEGRAVYLLHLMISAANPSIQIEEIEDAVARTPWRMPEEQDDKCLPWPSVIQYIGVEYDKLLGGIGPTKKPSAAILEFLGQEQ